MVKSLFKSFPATTCCGNSATPKKWATPQGHSSWHSRRASPAHPSGHTALWRHEANEAQCSGSKKRCLFTCILVVIFLFRGWKRPAWGSAP